MKLFMFYVGGNFRNSNTELHDVRFSVGETVPDCYDDLRAQWWGDPESLHLDCWGEVAQADGYDVLLTKEPPTAGEHRLFFVNLGGYDAAEFAELHRNVLVVAPDEVAAKARALLVTDGWSQPHKDRLLEVEKMLDVGTAIQRAGCFMSLSRATTEKPFSFEIGYVPIA
jgi:hypothetical protein